MTVRRLYVAGHMIEVSGRGYEPSGNFSMNGSGVGKSEPLSMLLQAAVLASDARVEQKTVPVRGKSKAIRLRARWCRGGESGLNKPALDAQFSRISEIPFTAETKRMTTLHQTPGGVVAYAKGAPEVIVQSCASQLTETGVEPLDDAPRRSAGARAADGGRSVARFGRGL